MARKNITLTAKNMGISTPIIARGVNPHEAIRQSALTLDGPALDAPAWAHDIVIVDATPNGTPGFYHIPVTGYQAYASDRGFAIDDNIQAFMDKFAPRLGLVCYGTEQAEMNMLSEVCGEDTVDCEYNNVVMLHDAYITRVILEGVDETFASKVLVGGCLKVVKYTNPNDNTDVRIVLTASYEGDAPACYDAATLAEIPGTTVINAGIYRDTNTGTVHTTIDFVC